MQQSAQEPFLFLLTLTFDLVEFTNDPVSSRLAHFDVNPERRETSEVLHERSEKVKL